ncbi:MAG TPA: acetylglutamate kinase [Phnomibacter sp.]|nr:acetylglutamate kinase [Phnomibacter sp.]
MAEKLTIVKIGGNVIDHPDALDLFLQRFASIPGARVLVHGGGKIASRIGEKLGIESKYAEGRRITDDATLDLVTMVYGGLLNKKIVAALQALGCNAIGLTGADANIIPAEKRPVNTIDYGWAGDVDEKMVGASTLQRLLQAGLVPVCAPLTHDGKGHMLNTNADTIASSLAIALSPFFEVGLIYCFEKRGVLLSIDDDNSVVERIDREIFSRMKDDGKLHSGILPKIGNALLAIEKGVRRVVIGHADDLLANMTEEIMGTIIE